jgi:hypothetical protein
VTGRDLGRLAASAGGFGWQLAASAGGPGMSAGARQSIASMLVPERMIVELPL